MENSFETIHPWISYFFINSGVPLEHVILLMLFPIIATVVVILRQVLGIKAFGIYTPTIITVAFMEIAQKNFWDLKYAITIYIIVLATGMVMRYALKKMRFLYLPRVAIMITIVSFVTLVSLALAGSMLRTGFASASIFAILIIITLVEKFVAVQIEKGTKTASILALETLIIALVGYTLMSHQTFIGYSIISFVLAYPFVILLILPLNAFIGKWTGLRLNEYFRFREVLKKIKE